MANTCNCCGCVVVDGATSVVGGAGSPGDPFNIEVLDPLFSSQKYAFRRQRSTNQSIPDNTFTAVDFTGAVAGSFDRGAFFTAPSTFTAPSSGMYIFGGTVAFEDNATGARVIDVIKNDTIVLCQMESDSSAGAIHFVTTSFSAPLFETETIKLRVGHNAGVALNIVVNAEQSPVFWAIYVGRFV